MADLANTLKRLSETIEARKGSDPDSSYTAKLLSKGVVKIAQKVGEEAVETALAAATEDRDGLAGESADLLYHLLVLWTAAGLTPEDVAAVLDARHGISGIAEKASRKE